MSGVSGIVSVFFRNAAAVHTVALDFHFKAPCNVPDILRTAIG
jgi:hypothetical protein